MQTPDCIAIRPLIDLVFKPKRELIWAGMFLVRQSGPQARQITARPQGVDQHLGQRPRRGGEGAEAVHNGRLTCGSMSSCAIVVMMLSLSRNDEGLQPFVIA